MFYQLRQVFWYDRNTGLFTWRIDTHGKHGRIMAGSPAGVCKKSTGYMVLHYKGKQYRAHRLAMMIIEAEELPDHAHVIHKDGNKINNRADNLELRWVSRKD